MDLEKIISEKQGTIIDVRTVEEFNMGHATGSINIPMNEIPERLDELKNLRAPLLLCCASGGRSGQTSQFLMRHGIECWNAGSWKDVKFYQSQMK